MKPQNLLVIMSDEHTRNRGTLAKDLDLVAQFLAWVILNDYERLIKDSIRNVVY